MQGTSVLACCGLCIQPHPRFRCQCSRLALLILIGATATALMLPRLPLQFLLLPPLPQLLLRCGPLLLFPASTYCCRFFQLPRRANAGACCPFSTWRSRSHTRACGCLRMPADARCPMRASAASYRQLLRSHPDHSLSTIRSAPTLCVKLFAARLYYWTTATECECARYCAGVWCFADTFYCA